MKTKKTKDTKSKIWPVAVICIIVGAIIGAASGMYFTKKSLVIPSFECVNGGETDKNGCCPGEVYTDMGDAGFNCCPEGGGDCFPPIR